MSLPRIASSADSRKRYISSGHGRERTYADLFEGVVVPELLVQLPAVRTAQYRTSHPTIHDLRTPVYQTAYQDAGQCYACAMLCLTRTYAQARGIRPAPRGRTPPARLVDA
eukprot:1597821-Rhodomonas_salina.2